MQLNCAQRQPKLSTAALCWALSCLGAITAWADTLPNAGQLQQSIPTDRGTNSPFNMPNSMPPAIPKTTTSGGARFKVSKFKWVGNSIYSDAVLNGLTTDVVGKSVDFGQLEAIALVIANHYRAEGHVVQTNLPAQDISNGVVTIEIIEATFGKVLMDGPSSKRVEASRIEETILAFQAQGAKLNSNNIDRALAVLSDLAGIRVQGHLVQGAFPGQTDFLVTTQDSPATSFDTSVDNAGSRSTGQGRAAFNFSLKSPLHMGDQWAFNAMVTSGSDYFRTAYRWPVGHSGGSLSLHASRLNYKVTQSAFSALPLRGQADAYGFESTYPWTWRRHKLSAVLGWDLKRYLNQRDAQDVSNYDTRALNMGLQGQFNDPLAGGGHSNWQVVGTGGQLSHRTVLTDNPTPGRYNKIKYAFNRTQELTPRWSLVAALNGQTSRTNLDASEKMYLGGMTAVRAYPSSEAGGSRGHLLNLELRQRLNSESTWFAFYDHGQVVVSPTSNDALNQLSLKGCGLGYAFVSAQGINVKAMVARRLGQNPNPTSTGQDQDGSLVKNRFWLSASMPF